MLIKLQLEEQEIDNICRRLTAGQMSYQEALYIKALIDKLVAQANDPAMQGRVAAAPAPVPPAPAEGPPSAA